MHKNINWSTDVFVVFLCIIRWQRCILDSLLWLREVGACCVTLLMKNICDTEQSYPITKKVWEKNKIRVLHRLLGVMICQQKNRTAAASRSFLYGIIIMWDKLSARVKAPNKAQLNNSYPNVNKLRDTNYSLYKYIDTFYNLLLAWIIA